MTQESRAKVLQALVNELVREQSTIPGGILLVASPDRRWTAASGFADPAAELRMGVEDQFVADSISKMMTATLALQLAEEGALSLDRCIGEYVPDGILDGLKDFDGHEFADTVTLRHLLGHRSGLADDWNTEGFLDLILEDPQRR